MRNPESKTMRQRQFQIPTQAQLRAAMAFHGMVKRPKHDENGNPIKDANGNVVLEAQRAENPTAEFVKWFNAALDAQARKRGEPLGAFYLDPESEEGKKQLQVIQSRLSRILRNEYRRIGGKMVPVKWDGENLRRLDTKEIVPEDAQALELPKFPGITSARRAAPQAFDIDEAGLADLANSPYTQEQEDLLADLA